MTFLNLTKETLLDLTVNIIPMAILVGMTALFAAVDPWGWDPLLFLMTHFLTLFPFVVLAVVTYIAGTVVQRDEGKVTHTE